MWIGKIGEKFLMDISITYIVKRPLSPFNFFEFKRRFLLNMIESIEKNLLISFKQVFKVSFSSIFIHSLLIISIDIKEIGKMTDKVI